MPCIFGGRVPFCFRMIAVAAMTASSDSFLNHRDAFEDVNAEQALRVRVATGAFSSPCARAFSGSDKEKADQRGGRLARPLHPTPTRASQPPRMSVSIHSSIQPGSGDSRGRRRGEPASGRRTHAHRSAMPFSAPFSAARRRAAPRRARGQPAHPGARKRRAARRRETPRTSAPLRAAHRGPQSRSARNDSRSGRSSRSRSAASMLGTPRPDSSAASPHHRPLSSSRTTEKSRKTWQR